MRTAPALALLTVGAILAYAVNVSIPGLDINVVGIVLALVGLLWLAVEIGLQVAASSRRRPNPRRERASAEDPPAPRQPDPYDPVVGPSRSEEPPGRRGPRADRDANDPTRVMPRRRP
jgi:hypothetical protein